MQHQKCTKAEKIKRLHEIEELLIRGASRTEILQYSRKTWGISTASIDKYIGIANKRFEKDSEVVRQQQIGLAIRRYSKLHRKALEAGDLREARANQTALDKLLGLQAPVQVEQHLEIDTRKIREQIREADVSMGDDSTLDTDS